MANSEKGKQAKNGGNKEKIPVANKSRLVPVLFVILLLGLGFYFYTVLRDTNESPASDNPPVNTANESEIDELDVALYITPDQAEAAEGEKETVEVWVDTKGQLVNAVDVSLEYNEDLLDFVSLDDSDSAFEIDVDSDDGNGKVRFARAQVDGASGKLLIAKIVFVPTENDGVAAITFNEMDSVVVRHTDNTNILSGTVGASITLEEGN